jgi:hypothetical protein
MKHLFFDCETLGQPVENCAVIDFSFLVIDTNRFLSDRPYNVSDISLVKKFKLSVKDQVDNYGWMVYKDTVEFWEKLPEAARKNIVPKKSDLKVSEFVIGLCEYMNDQGKIDYWWSRSNTFDPVILARIFDAEKKHLTFKEYFPFWRVRDIRTYIDAKLDFPKKNGFMPMKNENHWNSVFVEHDSAWDVLADALRMQAIVRAENDLEQV